MEKKFVNVRKAECEKPIGEKTAVTNKWSEVTCKSCLSVKNMMKTSDMQCGAQNE